jgi:hypothetical protein
MGLRRRVSQDIEERYAADKALASGYDAKLAAAREAERALRRAQAEGRSGEETRVLAVALDMALTDALSAAEAAERAVMGTRTYAPADGKPEEVRAAEIAERKARARSDVRPCTDEVDRLRTAREVHRLGFRDARKIAAPS